jgi:uncharacterized membrane protein
MTTISLLKKTYNKHTTRFIELDLLRGFAIIFMIFLHIIWDLDYFGILPMNTQIYRFQICVPAMFFVLLGICLNVSSSKKINKLIIDEKKFYRHLFLRGLKIIGLGMVITLVTMIFLPDRPIIFGVLHCIGFSIILSIPFLKLKYLNIIPATLSILAGYFFGQIAVENPTFLHLAVGLHQSNIALHTVDYFPLLPWFGACLIGIALGNLLYKNNIRRFKIPDISRYKPVAIFSWLGKHSLAIYLVHQPIIAGVLSIYVII